MELNHCLNPQKPMCVEGLVKSKPEKVGQRQREGDDVTTRESPKRCCGSATNGHCWTADHKAHEQLAA
jgi:hypothetical protein